MNIIKQHTSPDGYECRLINHSSNRRGKWQIKLDDEWLGLGDVASAYPGMTTDKLSHRCRAKMDVFPTSVRFVQSMRIRFRGQTSKGKPFSISAYPSEWAQRWAEIRGVTLTRSLRQAFTAHLGRELGRSPQDAEGALKRTLKGFAGNASQIA